MTKEQLMLQASLEACRQRTDKLRYSVQKNAYLFPITQAQLATFSDEQEESIDALILRYSQCVTMIQEQLFRGIAYLEQATARIERLNLVMEEANFVIASFDVHRHPCRVVSPALTHEKTTRNSTPSLHGRVRPAAAGLHSARTHHRRLHRHQPRARPSAA